jgi:UDP-2,3-diacylglucosamine pyrophosphatase LpxH
VRRPISEPKEEEDARIEMEQRQFYEDVMARFQCRCVVCGSMHGVTVHEINSKAQYPTTWWLDVHNGVTLCQPDHDRVHMMTSSEARAFCKFHAEKTLQELHSK